MAPKKFTATDVHRISMLAQIPTKPAEEEKLAAGFNQVIAVVDTLNQIDIKGIEPTHQVTGLTNVFREDEVDEARMFTQKEALANANKTHDGYFVVDQILED
jgi:aspartyl-tRNA(Asn)/glutamyl-tRNA(Gln) amidotransferase subunit C